MDNIVKRLIEEKLSILIRQPLIDIGRASNLLWLSFGERISTLDRKGNEIQKGKYGLNVQCAWRLSQNNQIIVASKDFYIPKTGLDYNLFDWEEYGNNRFDERISSFKPMINTTNLSVINISVDNIGGFKIDLDLGIKFEIFPDDSLEDEFWRLIINGNKSEHFVFVDKEE